DEVMPADAGYLGLQRESGREIIVQKWKTTSKNLRPTYGHTDILGALATIPYLGGISMTCAQIFLFGDLQQSTVSLDFGHAKRIPVEQTIDRLKRAHTIPSLRGATIYALGVDPIGKTAGFYTTLHDF